MTNGPLSLPPFRAYTDKPLAPPGYSNQGTVNMQYSRGFEEACRGYSKFRQVVAATDTVAQRGAYVDPDGNERHYYIVGTTFYPETGSDTPTSLGSVTTPTWNWAVVPFGAPSWVNINLNGDVTDARVVRGTTLELVALQIASPTAVVPTTATTGGTIADGMYYIRQSYIDDSGATTVESAPCDVLSVTTSGGGASTISVPEPASVPARATKIRVYMTSVGATDAPGNYHLQTTYTKGSGTYTRTTPPDTSGANPPNRNGFYQQATMPIGTARVACEHLGRLFFASDEDNTIYWSERDAPNQYYTTNFLEGFAGQIRGMASMNGVLYVFTSDAIYLVTGDFSRDSTGAAPTYAVNASEPQRIDHGVGCVSHGTITRIGPTVYFMSTQGPAMISGSTVRLLRPEDFAGTVFGRRGDSVLDWGYADRWSACDDVENGTYSILVTRKVNSSRAMDGASTAGMPDLILRWDYRHGVRAPDMRLGDMTHLSSSLNGTIGSLSRKVELMAMGPHGYCLQLNTGWSGGGATTAATDSNNDGKLATAQTTTTATIENTGIAADDLIGQTVTVFYQDEDTSYPGVVATKTIKDNTATSGGTITITWNGALPAPSGTLCTFRVAGYELRTEWMGDLRDYDPSLSPDSDAIVQEVRYYLHPTAQTEAVT